MYISCLNFRRPPGRLPLKRNLLAGGGARGGAGQVKVKWDRGMDEKLVEKLVGLAPRLGQRALQDREQLGEQLSAKTPTAAGETRAAPRAQSHQNKR